MLQRMRHPKSVRNRELFKLNFCIIKYVVSMLKSCPKCNVQEDSANATQSVSGYQYNYTTQHNLLPILNKISHSSSGLVGFVSTLWARTAACRSRCRECSRREATGRLS